MKGAGMAVVTPGLTARVVRRRELFPAVAQQGRASLEPRCGAEPTPTGSSHRVP